MFDLPNAKRYVLGHKSSTKKPSTKLQHAPRRVLTSSLLSQSSVRRDQLLSRDSSSPSPSPPPESAYPDAQERLGALLNLDSLLAPSAPEPTTTTTTAPDNNPENEDEEQEFEFRLFQTAPKKAADKETGEPETTQKLKIRLRSPTPTAGVNGEGRFVNPFRGWQYYFSAPGLLSGETKVDGEEDAGLLLKRKQFEEVAVTGEEMMGWARVPWPGCHLPWRVIHLKRGQTKLPPRDAKDTSSTATVYVMDPPERIPTSRKKPGKKRRIQLRKRVVAAERAKETEAEKRNRKNREKKLKRRQKAREAKAALTATEGQGGETDPDGSAAGKVQDGSVAGEARDDVSVEMRD
ncbi:hypothetical protein ARAM_005982 [Aspergillus rambellii]|uniref:Uncharacterized protein n=1 Tax=Aspergillus rambellii TaxID=308745 RepID=A0A0F8V421_9EURO|nr:hypothetical protein ARAM_005982 [Aspergillus rambellii]